MGCFCMQCGLLVIVFASSPEILCDVRHTVHQRTVYGDGGFANMVCLY